MRFFPACSEARSRACQAAFLRLRFAPRSLRSFVVRWILAMALFASHLLGVAA